MNEIKSLDDLRKIRDATKKKIKAREKSDTIITIGMATCGLAAGAKDVMEAIHQELSVLGLEADVVSVG